MSEETPKTRQGRLKGAVNKFTTEMRAIIVELLNEYQNNGQMSEDFMSLNPRDRLAIAERLIQYTVPKYQAIALDVAVDKEKTIEDTLLELSQPLAPDLLPETKIESLDEAEETEE